MRSLHYLFMTLMLLSMTACGEANFGSSAPEPASQAVLKVSLTGALPAGSAIIGAGFSITLPTDVTPDMASDAEAATVITSSGTFAGGIDTPPVYNAATATAPGTIAVALANAAPAGVTDVGEVATITLRLSNGAAPSATSFAISDVKVIDTGGNSVTGIGAAVSSVVLQ